MFSISSDFLGSTLPFICQNRPEAVSRSSVHNNDVWEVSHSLSELHAVSADVWCFPSHMEMSATRAGDTFQRRVPLTLNWARASTFVKGLLARHRKIRRKIKLVVGGA